MKINEINSIGRCIYHWETAREIKEIFVWDKDITSFPREFIVNAINGKQALKVAKYRGLEISDKCINEESLYIFRWNVAGTKLVPIRLTMSRKTIRNYNNPTYIIRLKQDYLRCIYN